MNYQPLISHLERFLRGEDRSVQWANDAETLLDELEPRDELLDELQDDLSLYFPGGGPYLVDESTMEGRVRHVLKTLESRAVTRTTTMRLRATVRRVTGKTHHVVRVDVVSDALLPTPAYVEIEPSRDGAFHLLYFDSNGECLTDTWHETEARAKEQAQFEFEIGEADWSAC